MRRLLTILGVLTVCAALTACSLFQPGQGSAPPTPTLSPAPVSISPTSTRTSVGRDCCTFG